jgi:NitT/TauT family transport system permease protein
LLLRLLPLISALSFLLLWQLVSGWLDTNLLPSPLTVLAVLWQSLLSGELPHHLGVTLARLAVSFSLAMLLGTALGILLGRRPGLDRFFDGWVMLFLNVPALVTIILCYIWFGLDEFAAILAVVINKIPNVVVTVREGTRSLDRNLLEMASLYRFGWVKTVRHVIAPQLYPFLMAASRTGLALIWKIILVVELLGRSDGMGYQLHLFFQLFDVAALLAWSLGFVLVIQGLEWLVLKPLDARARRWQQ